MVVVLSIVGYGVWLVIRRQSQPATADHSPDNDIIRLAFAPNTDHPHLVTGGGVLYAPTDDGWVRLLPNNILNEHVNDLYIEQPSGLWVVTNSGLLQAPLNDRNPTWTRIEGVPPSTFIDAMHGFTFAMGASGVARGPKEWRMLKMPNPSASSSGLAMLGDHSHVILNGDSLALTHDMGLSWELVPTDDMPEMKLDTAQLIGADAKGYLLVTLATGLYRWNYIERTWSQLASLPDDTSIDALQLFQDQLYALADGRLYLLKANQWQLMDLSSTLGSGYQLTTVRNHRLTELWVADSTQHKLWFTHDLQTWTPLDLRLEVNAE